MKVLSNLLSILLVGSGGKTMFRKLGPIIRHSILSKIKQQMSSLDDVADCVEEHLPVSKHDRQLATMKQTAHMLQQYQRE